MHVHTAVTAAQRAAAAKAGEIGGSLVTARRHCEALEEEVCSRGVRTAAQEAALRGGGDTGGASSISAAEQQNRMRIAARQRPHLSLGPDSD